MEVEKENIVKGDSRRSTIHERPACRTWLQANYTPIQTNLDAKKYDIKALSFEFTTPYIIGKIDLAMRELHISRSRSLIPVEIRSINQCVWRANR